MSIRTGLGILFWNTTVDGIVFLMRRRALGRDPKQEEPDPGGAPRRRSHNHDIHILK
jgi:hypothetical protein